MKKLIAILTLQVVIMLSGVHSAPAAGGGKIYVALSDDAGIAVVDPVALDAWSAIKSGKNNAKLKASNDGRFLYVSVNGDNKVKRIDTLTDKVINEVETGASPFNMELTPDGKLLLVCDDIGLSIIETGEFVKTKKVDLGGRPQAFKISPDGKNAFFAVGDPNPGLVVLDMKSLNQISKTDLSGEINDMAFSPGGDKLYINDVNNNKIQILDTSTLAVIDGIASYGKNGLALSKDGTEIWFSGPEAKLTVYSITEKKVIAEPPCAGNGCMDPRITFSHDGKLVFAGPAGDDCHVLNVYDAQKKTISGEIKLSGIPKSVIDLAK